MNAFTDLAERQIATPCKARMRAIERRAAHKTAAEKALAKRDKLLRLWKHHNRVELDAALAGPHGQAINRLIEFLDAMTLKHAAALVELVRGEDWHSTDAETRFLVLRLVNQAITHLREKNGLSPFDDGFPGDPPNVFIIIRGLLA